MAKDKGTVLLTGGSGFLGSHTADALTDAGYKVRIFDRARSPYLRDNQEMVIGDICDAQSITDAAKGCKYIYHLAGIADIEEAKTNPLLSCQVNIQGTLHALQAAKENNVERFVFASTVYVYSTLGDFYRVTKQACENYIETFGDIHGLPFTILRYGSLYGRRAGPTNGINRLLSTAINSNEIVYNGDPESMREYIHVTDAAKLSVDILDDTYKNQHLILTGRERMKVTDLMRMISEMLPHKPTLKFGEENLAGHYVVTPFSYNPKIAHKVTRIDHIDLGQGLLDCIEELSDDEQKTISL